MNFRKDKRIKKKGIADGKPLATYGSKHYETYPKN